MLRIAFLPLAGVLLAAPPALADPCTARLPSRPGQTFGGVVRYVGDGDSLCVGSSRDPRTWIEVRLADFDAPELHAPGGQAAKTRLKQIAEGRPLACVAVRGRQGRVVVHDRTIAQCRLDGRPVGVLLREAGGVLGGR